MTDQQLGLLTLRFFDHALSREVDEENIIQRFGYEFTWVPAMPAPTQDNTHIRGKPFRVYLTPETKRVTLYLGRAEFSTNPLVYEDGPFIPQILQGFLVELDSYPHNNVLEIQIIRKKDQETWQLELLNATATIQPIQNQISPELPPELPVDPVPRLGLSLPEIHMWWLIDGTLSEASFTKCTSLAAWFTQLVGRQARVNATFIVVGEYLELCSWNDRPAPFGAYTVSSQEPVVSGAQAFVQRVLKAKGLPRMLRDDPASAIETGLKVFADQIDLGRPPAKMPLWIYVLGNSLPHYSIEELNNRFISIVPTEELENIHWLNEFQRITKRENTFIQPVWVEDQEIIWKWSDTSIVDTNGFPIALEEARRWWHSITHNVPQTITMHLNTSTIDIGAELRDVMWQNHRPSIRALDPCVYPLYSPFENLEFNF